MYMCMQQHANYGMTLIARVTPGNTTIKISRRLIYLPSLILNFYYVLIQERATQIPTGKDSRFSLGYRNRDFCYETVIIPMFQKIRT